MTAEQVVREANDRENQENILDQLKNGVRALHAPRSTLEANWAYMVIASLAWSLKAWLALSLPVVPRWKEKPDILSELERDKHEQVRAHARAYESEHGPLAISAITIWRCASHRESALRGQPARYSLSTRLRIWRCASTEKTTRQTAVETDSFNKCIPGLS